MGSRGEGREGSREVGREGGREEGREGGRERGRKGERGRERAPEVELVWGHLEDDGPHIRQERRLGHVPPPLQRPHEPAQV